MDKETEPKTEIPTTEQTEAAETTPAPTEETAAAEATTEPASNGAQTLNFDPTKIADNKPKKIAVNFSDSSFLTQYLTKTTGTGETKETAAKAGKEIPINETEAEKLKRIAADVKFQEQDNTLTVEDYEDFADIIIEMIDWAISWACMWWAKDTTDKPYMQNERKMSRLKKMLSRIMIRNSAKMNFTVLFLVVIVIAYGSSVRKAHQHRKEVLDQDNETIKNTGPTTQKEVKHERVTEPIITPEAKPQQEQEQETIVPYMHKDFNRIDIRTNYFQNAA